MKYEINISDALLITSILTDFINEHSTQENLSNRVKHIRDTIIYSTTTNLVTDNGKIDY